MSARRRPLSGISPSIEEMTPRVKLLPVGLVKTRTPCSRRIATSILVVVVLPLVPVTTTMPRGSPRQRVREEPRVHPLDDQPGQCRPAAPEP